jgi:predicted nucleic-acid-binding Zn-ribbon protein
MKKIKTKYANAQVNPNFYSTIVIKGEEEIAVGYILAPFILQAVDKPSRAYAKFMKIYHKAHKVCPKCGNSSYLTTLIGFPLYMSKKEEYKDLNIIKCQKCGYSGTAHSLISKKEYDNSKIKKNK